MRGLGRIVAGAAFLALVGASLLAQPIPEVRDVKVVIYLNERCDCCVEYNDELLALLRKLGIAKVEIVSLFQNRERLGELEEMYRKLGIPQDYRTGYLVKVGDLLFIEGHPPLGVVEKAILSAPGLGEAVVISQRDMHLWRTKNEYNIITSSGTVLSCTAHDVVEECEEAGRAVGSERPSPETFLLLVVSSGFVDGVNPCAISLLALFAVATFTAALKMVGRDRIRHVSSRVFRAGAPSSWEC